MTAAPTMERVPEHPVRWHPYADIFPWIEGPAFDDLVESVRQNGVLEPVVFLDGAILDGRNRYMAARKAGVAYPRIDFDGDDPLAFVLAKNLSRRHLTESQRAMVATRIAKIPKGVRSDTAIAVSETTQEAAAAALNVSPDSVQRARVVQEHGAADLVAAVDNGKVAVSTAAAIARLPVDRQAEILAEVTRSGSGRKAFAKVAKDIRAERQATKANKRAVTEEILGRQQMAMPSKRYGVILADPEWRFEPYSRSSGMDRAADNHYPTSPLDEIKGRDVQSIAAKDCALFLWATAPMMPQALEVMLAWGFTYVSQTIWAKDRLGTGYWFRNKHEILMVGVRGDIPAPAMGTQWPSIVEAPVGAHSAKPDVFLELVETYFPTLPKIELNRRGPARPGWDAWGYEAEAAA